MKEVNLLELHETGFTEQGKRGCLRFKIVRTIIEVNRKMCEPVEATKFRLKEEPKIKQKMF